jgi:hypothetical protein
LVLGEKVSGLYTQEEIDIARAGGERLLDSLASAELARRLVVLQRQRLAESQVLDRRTRACCTTTCCPNFTPRCCT